MAALYTLSVTKSKPDPNVTCGVHLIHSHSASLTWPSGRGLVQLTVSFTVTGFDAANHPILAVFGPSVNQTVTTNLALVSATEHSVAIKPQGGTFIQGQGQGLSDSHGTWFGSADGSLWLYTASRGIEKVASVPPQPGGGGVPYDPTGGIAGPCA